MKLNIPYISFAVIVLIPLVFFVFTSCSALGTKPGDNMKDKLAKSSHYNAEKEVFENRDKEAFEQMNKRDKLEGGFLKFLLGDDKQEWPPEPGLPVFKPNLDEFISAKNEMKVVWFGHSTFLVNFYGKIILVDPVFSDYASPVFFAIRRFQKTPLCLEEMPKIDYILISHDHYDHLDMKAMKFFREKKDIKFLVPLGVSSHLIGWGVDENQITEFDWWQEEKIGDLNFIATPAQHFSGRSLNDKNKTLWAGWIVKNSEHKLFFSGDSGYDTHFKEIGERHGPFDIAFVESGQYNKAWEEVHLLPEQTIQAFYDVKGKILFPVHWGAFKLSIHSWYDPIEKAYTAAQEKGFLLIAPKIGEIVTVNKNYKLQTWWKEFINKK